MAGPLDGKVAIVTGAGSGMGRAICIALAAEGASLAIGGRNAANLRETAGSLAGEPLVVPTDVTDPNQVDALVQACLARWGRIDLLVNNAGTNTRRRSWADATLEDWNSTVRTNLDGVFFCTRAVLPAMRAQKDGQIINISSMAGRVASVMSGVPYSAAKFGVLALTQSTNLEEWRNGIRATCVEPGETATPILEMRPEVPPRESWKDMLQAEDIADLVRYLATLPRRVLVEEIAIRPTVRRVS